MLCLFIFVITIMDLKRYAIGHLEGLSLWAFYIEEEKPHTNTNTIRRRVSLVKE